MRIKYGLMVMAAFFITATAQNFKSAHVRDIALMPQQNDCRNVLDLSGIWKFKVDSADIGEKSKWYDGLNGTRQIAVPGSWNDQFTDLHNYLSASWYETSTFIPSSWRGQDIYIRVGSAVYNAKLWINGRPVGIHEGGFVPFAFDISDDVKWNEENRIVIRVENELKLTRVPLGGNKSGAMSSQNYPNTNYDFFPFAGLNRAVKLFAVPRNHITDVTVKTNYQGSEGLVNVTVKTVGNVSSGNIVITDGAKKIQKKIKLENGMAHASLTIPDVKLWSPESPTLYHIEVTLGEGQNIVDRYALQTGVRTISHNDKQLLLNGKPLMLRGFGRHEDFAIFGRGTANPVAIKDFELMKWTGANSFRTSHYPYSEEQYDLADREGFLVIDEIPAVGLYFFDDSADVEARKKVCEQYLLEMQTRDKNHPSVIIWSVANEPNPKNMGSRAPKSDNQAEENRVAMDFLGTLVRQAKAFDDSRPASFVGVMGGPMEWLSLGDITMINRYYGWYTNVGSFDTGMKYLSMELDKIHSTYAKPIIMTEFGADAISGVHSVDDDLFSEDFQTKVIRNTLQVLDSKDYVSGTMVWTLADFRTSQSIIRMAGMNYKGVFTWDRKPKQVATLLRELWRK